MVLRRHRRISRPVRVRMDALLGGREQRLYLVVQRLRARAHEIDLRVVPPRLVGKGEQPVAVVGRPELRAGARNVHGREEPVSDVLDRPPAAQSDVRQLLHRFGLLKCPQGTPKPLAEVRDGVAQMRHHRVSHEGEDLAALALPVGDSTRLLEVVVAVENRVTAVQAFP